MPLPKSRPEFWLCTSNATTQQHLFTEAADGRNGLQVRRVATNILYTHGRLTRRDIPTWFLGLRLSSPHQTKPICYEMSHRASDFTSVEQLKQQKVEMRFGTWNIRDLYMARCKRVQYITTDTGNAERTGNYTISVEMGMRIINQDISKNEIILSATKRYSLLETALHIPKDL
jgi:hypothetical protein